MAWKVGQGRPRGSPALDDKLAVGIASGLSIQEAAENAGIASRTAQRRVKEATFIARIRILQDRAVARAVGVLTGNMAKAAGTAVELMHKDQPASIRLAALRTLLEYGFKGHQEDVRKELQELRTVIENAFADVPGVNDGLAPGGGETEEACPAAASGPGSGGPGDSGSEPLREVAG